MSSRSITRSLAIAAVAVFGAAACTSTPSAQRVAEDLVRTVARDFPDVEECMLDVVDGYDLNDLGSDANSDNTEISGPAIAELDQFEADLVDCDPEGVTRTSAP